MKKLQFKTEINAPAEKVWKALWDDVNYRNWTSVFSEGSHMVTDFKKGSKVHFLDGKGSGMYSTIAENVANKFMSFQHLGVIKDGKEQPMTEETKEWSGSLENYTLTENNGTTNLSVEVDMADAYAEYFNEIFPKALAKVKAIAEGGFNP
jgi:uncharacterized protein YndB with AHSA1/START domain